MPEAGFIRQRAEDEIKNPFVDWFIQLLFSALKLPRALAGDSESAYQQPLDSHGLSYFKELRTEYETLSQEDKNRNPSARDIIEAILKQQDFLAQEEKVQSELTDEKEKKKHQKYLNSLKTSWDDLLQFEKALLKLLPLDRLRKKAFNIRREYKEVAGEDAYRAYLESNPPSVKDGEEPELRADTEELLGELHWSYVSEPVQEAQRNTLLFTVLFGFVGVILLALLYTFTHWIITAYIGKGHWEFTPFPAVLFCGAAGAVFSSLIRLQRTGFDGNAIINLWKLNLMGVSAILAPFVGATSAFLLLLLFSSNLVSGNLFPKVQIMPSSCLCAPKCSSMATNGPAPESVIATTNIAQTAVTNPPTIPVPATNANSLTSSTPVATSNISSEAQGVKASKNGDKSDQQASETEGMKSNLLEYRICVSDYSQLIMLLVWSFIAGFSERLVPDIIDRLGKKVQ